MVNHIGEGSMNILVMPPTMNQAPMPSAYLILCFVAIAAAINAPTKVPSAWAKNGMIKFFGVIKGMDAFKLSRLVKPALSGGEIIKFLFIRFPCLTRLQIGRPLTTVKLFFRVDSKNFVLI